MSDVQKPLRSAAVEKAILSPWAERWIAEHALNEAKIAAAERVANDLGPAGHPQREAVIALTYAARMALAATSPATDRGDERFIVAIPRTLAEQGALEHDPLEWTADYLDEYARANSNEAGTAYMEDAAEVLRLVASARASSGEPEQGAALTDGDAGAEKDRGLPRRFCGGDIQHEGHVIWKGPRRDWCDGRAIPPSVPTPEPSSAHPCERGVHPEGGCNCENDFYRGDERQKRGAARIRAADKFLNGLVDEMDDLLARGMEPPGTFIGGAARGHVHGWYDCLAALGYDDERVDDASAEPRHTQDEATRIAETNRVGASTEKRDALTPIRERAQRAVLYELCPGPGMHWHDAYRDDVPALLAFIDGILKTPRCDAARSDSGEADEREALAHMAFEFANGCTIEQASQVYDRGVPVWKHYIDKAYAFADAALARLRAVGRDAEINDG